MGNIIVILIILSAVLPASCYIVRSKKKGECIGCPHSKQCSGKCRCSEEHLTQ